MADTTQVGIIGLSKMGEEMHEKMRNTKAMVSSAVVTDPVTTEMDVLFDFGDLVSDARNTRFTDDGIFHQRAAYTSAALLSCFTSPQEDSSSMKEVAALPNQFGGHSVRKS